MTVRQIRVAPHSVLSSPCEPVEQVTNGLRRLVADMIETMYAAPGVGLAAPQVGEGLRLFVFDAHDGLGARHLINPRIVSSSGRGIRQEGCLSVPGKFWPISRPNVVVVTGTDLDGNALTIKGAGLRARVILHEYDHLDGRLLTSRLPTPVRVGV